MRKNILLLICTLNSIASFSQVIISRDTEKSMLIQATNLVYYDAVLNPITIEQFNDSLNTGKYVVSIDSPNSKVFLKCKYPSKSMIIGNGMPTIRYDDIFGQSTEIAKIDRISVLSFWSITCPPCIQELQVFNIITKEYPLVDFYAITTDTEDSVSNFINKGNYNWDNIIIIPDYTEEASVLEIPVYPTTYIINNKKVIYDVVWGAYLRQTITSLEELYKTQQ